MVSSIGPLAAVRRGCSTRGGKGEGVSHGETLAFRMIELTQYTGIGGGSGSAVVVVALHIHAVFADYYY
jgi:hypothetical protein